MNSKQLIKLLIIFVCIGGIGAFLVTQSNRSWSEGEQGIGGLLMGEDFPLNEISKLVFKSKDGEMSLSKVDDTWRVQDRGNYAADFGKIRELLLSVAETKVLRPMKVGESQLGRLELLAPGEGEKSGTLMSFYGEADKELGSLLLGKQSMRQSESSSFGGGEMPDGRYLMVNGDVGSISQVSEAFTSVEVEPKSWLDKSFFKVEKLKSVSVTHPDPIHSWRVSRESETGEMVLDGLGEKEELDSSRSYSLQNMLSSPSFNDVVDATATADTLGMVAPIKVVMDTFEAFVYDIEIGKPNEEEEYPMKVKVSAVIPEERTPGTDEKDEDKEALDKEFAESVQGKTEKLGSESSFEEHAFWVSKWTVDALIKHRSEYIKAIEEEGDAAPAGDAIIAPPALPGLNLDSLTSPLNLDAE
jgi:hypothetical protein